MTKMIVEIAEKALAEKRDPYVAVAAVLYSVEEKDVTPLQRTKAKSEFYFQAYGDFDLIKKVNNG